MKHGTLKQRYQKARRLAAIFNESLRQGEKLPHLSQEDWAEVSPYKVRLTGQKYVVFKDEFLLNWKTPDDIGHLEPYRTLRLVGDREVGTDPKSPREQNTRYVPTGVHA